MLTKKCRGKQKIHPKSSIDGSPITVYTPRQEAMLWWHRLSHLQKISFLPNSYRRDYSSLTGREIEGIHKSSVKPA